MPDNNRLRSFFDHACLVRTMLLLDDPKAGAISSEVWTFLGTILDGKPLLPGVRELTFKTDPPTDENIARIVSHTLVRLWALYDDGKAFGDIATYQTTWRHIAARAPNLTVLSIEVRLFYCNIPSECFIPMSDFRHLRELTLVEAVVSWSAMPILSTFPALEHLSLDIHDELDDTNIPISPGFASLRELHCLDVTPRAQPEMLRRIIAICSSPLLSMLRTGNDKVRVGKVYTLSRWMRLCEVVADQYPALDIFRWQFAASDGTFPSEDRIVDDTDASLLNAFMPLFRLSSLTAVFVDFYTLDVRFTDAFFEATADAWPRIEKLAIRGLPPDLRRSENATGITLRSLVAFAEKCPRLTLLEMPYIHVPPAPAPVPRRSARIERQRAAEGSQAPNAVPEAANHPEHLDPATFPKLGHPLDSLHFDCAIRPEVADADSVGEILDGLFPYLDALGGINRGMVRAERAARHQWVRGQEAFWNEVKAVVNRSKRARDEEPLKRDGEYSRFIDLF